MRDPIQEAANPPPFPALEASDACAEPVRYPPTILTPTILPSAASSDEKETALRKTSADLSRENTVYQMAYR